MLSTLLPILLTILMVILLIVLLSVMFLMLLSPLSVVFFYFCQYIVVYIIINIVVYILSLFIITRMLLLLKNSKSTTARQSKVKKPVCAVPAWCSRNTFLARKVLLESLQIGWWEWQCCYPPGVACARAHCAPIGCCLQVLFGRVQRRTMTSTTTNTEIKVLKGWFWRWRCTIPNIFNIA